MEQRLAAQEGARPHWGSPFHPKDGVALFIDWENLKRSANHVFARLPDLVAIKKAAARFGRLVLARAYANWQDGQHQDECEYLYNQGIDPVFVSTRKDPSAKESSPGDKREEMIKNSADVRMAIECTREAISNGSVGTVVLVSGDGAFIHVVNLVRSLGKRVAVIAVSHGLSSPLTYLADRFILYDSLVCGSSYHGREREGKIREALAALAESAREIRQEERENSFSVLKTLLRSKIAGFEEEELGFPKFEYLVLSAEKEGLVRANVTGWQQEIYLGDEVRDLRGDPLPGAWEWGWLIRWLKEKGPQFENVLQEASEKEGVLSNLSGAKADALVEKARKSGVIFRHQELRYYPSTGGKAPYQDLRLNELNPRVQVYLGLKANAPFFLSREAAASVPERSLADQYRTCLRKGGMKAISLPRAERLEILRRFYEFMAADRDMRMSLKEKADRFKEACEAANASWSRARVNSLIYLTFRSRCLEFQGPPNFFSPGSLRPGLGFEELVRRCDQVCMAMLMARDPSLDPAQAAEVILDSAEEVGEIEELLDEMIAEGIIRREGEKLFLAAPESAAFSDEGGDDSTL